MRFLYFFGLPVSSIGLCMFTPVWLSETPLLAWFFLTVQYGYMAYLSLLTAGLVQKHVQIAFYLMVIASSSLMVMGASAGLYLVYGLQNTEHMTDGFEALYFSTVSFSTLGFGDITPSPGISRLVAASEAVIGNLHLALFAASGFFILSSGRT